MGAVGGRLKDRALKGAVQMICLALLLDLPVTQTPFNLSILKPNTCIPVKNQFLRRPPPPR